MRASLESKERDLDISRPTAMYSSCPVCSDAGLRRLWEVNGYTIARCSACSLVFVQNKIAAEELAAHYASIGAEAEVYDRPNVECLNYYYEKLAALIRRRFPEPGKVLDIGCSHGWFLDVMKGWECHGCEIISADAEGARERHGERIITGSFEDYPLREGYFDVITLQDVFDHFRDPMTALEKCHRMLRPGGLIVIKVHNVSCLYAKLTGSNFYAFIPPAHLFYYDRRTLSRALSNSGFQVVDAKFIAHVLKIKTVFLRLSCGNYDSRFYRIYKALDDTTLGELKVRKNLHDIITVLAVKAA